MLYRLLRKNLFIIIIGCGLLSIVGYRVLSNTRFSKNPDVMSSDSSSTKQQNINNDNGIRLNPKISPRRKGNIGSGHGHFIGGIPIPEISEEKRKRISALYDGNSWDKDPSWAKEGPPREEVDILVEGLNNLSAAKYLKALGGYGDYAREYADKALADNPNDFETLFIWTQLRSSNETVEKELGYRSLLEMDPNSIAALVGLGSIIKKDAPEEAIELLEKANRLEPSEGLYELGWAYQRMGDYDKAIPMLEKAYGRYNHRWMLSEIESIKAGTPQIPLIQRESQEYQQDETDSSADKALLTEPAPPQSDGSIGIEAEKEISSPISTDLYQINDIGLAYIFQICYCSWMKHKKHQVFPHFSVEVLKQRYLECECPCERTHWHIIWLLADTTHTRTPREVAEIVGCTPDWVRKLLKRYNADGEAAIRDKRKNNGRKRFLDATQQAALEVALSAPPADGGLWTGPKVAAWISETLERPVSDVSGWKYLRRLGWTLQTPRPQHQAVATPDEQQAFKKKLKERVAVLASQAPEKPVEIWAEDETRLGLLPVQRRVWAKQGERPIAPVCPAYKWLYGFGFVRPQTGETYWLLMPSVSVAVMNLALAEFARDVNPEGKKQIILLLDRAGFHTGKDLEVPEGIELFYLPPWTPELQPAERLWPLLREAIANKVFASLCALEEVLIKRCQWFPKNRKKVQRLVGFQWICKMEKQYGSC